MSHSAGPWAIDGEFDAEIAVTIVDAQGYPICEVEPLMEDWAADEIANARLIAAAPELLEACKRIANWTSADPPWGEFVRSAISKAEGTPSTVEKSQADVSQKPSEAKP